MLTSKIVLATGNQGKVAELASMLTSLALEVVAQSEFKVPEVAETGSTFVENAIIKARHAARVTGLPAIADDSGLAVDALGGDPGDYSARFAGEDATDKDNIHKLLTQMAAIPNHLRQARFICVLVYMRHAEDPTPIICQGHWQGRITDKVIGENGFGYDPVFWLDQQNCTSAQLTPGDKNTLSHRGQALRQLLKKLAEQLA
jgi:XTP/dITP diphosphohydrolase